MDLPTRQAAEELVREGEARNPGPWGNHSRMAAAAAQHIAANVPGMDSEAAYILGLLHDIGRRYGVAGMRHITDGYHYMVQLGFPHAARICMTHSFPLQEPRAMLGWDGSTADKAFVYNYIQSAEYDDYDRLMQLADALALPGGCCLIEKRMVDVTLRYGFNDFTVQKWNAIFSVQRYFEDKIGDSIYTGLPYLLETTFGSHFHPQAAANRAC